MFWFIYDDPDRVNKLDAPILYLESGKEVALFLRDLLQERCAASALATRANLAAPLSVLEFASGYGRASRHFANELPGVDIVACDVHQEAVAFLREMGIKACQSSSIPEQLHTDHNFDVVFALSFFTHMPRSTWGRWLRALAEQLTPEGLLIFTAHGEQSQKLMGVGALEADGFFYGPWSEQKDLPLTEYGGSVTTFDFVYRQSLQCGLTLLLYKQEAIAHHDVYILQRRRENGFVAPTSGDLRGVLEQNKRLLAEVGALKTSNSWRLTAPLRVVSDAVKRVKSLRNDPRHVASSSGSRTGPPGRDPNRPI